MNDTEGNDLDDKSIEIGKDYEYKLEHVVPNNTDLKTLTLYDDLEDVLELKMMVYRFLTQKVMISLKKVNLRLILINQATRGSKRAN